MHTRERINQHRVEYSTAMKKNTRDFPVVGTSPSSVAGCGFDPWLGSWDPTCLVAKEPKHETEAIFNGDFENGPHQKKKEHTMLRCSIAVESHRRDVVQ